MSGRPQSPKIEVATVAPLLSVRHGTSAVEFYKQAFGASEVFRIESDDGAVVARLSVGGSEFWLADESPEHANFSPESLGGGSVRMILMVDNPDGIFERAVTAGATVVYKVANQPYGWRVGRVVDPFGHHWEIAKPLCGELKKPGGSGPNLPASPPPSPVSRQTND